MDVDGLTSLTGHGRSDLSPTLATLLMRRGFDLNDVPGAALEHALNEAEPRPLLQVRCLNPRCLVLCDWTQARGRMPKFCSGKCRQQYVQNRARLEREIALITGSINRPDTGPRLKRRLTSERAQRLFEFSRYVEPESVGEDE